MSNTNLLGSEEWAIVGSIDPASLNTTTQTADVDMSLFEQVMFVVQTGALGTAATVIASIASAATVTPTVDVTDKVGATLGDSPATTSDNLQVIINLRGDELTEGHRYVRGKVITGVAASLVSAVMLGKKKALPSSDSDEASVTEIVS